MKFIAIIPARYASSRLPGKPLLDIGGKPMIQHVYERVKIAVNDVIVATDDDRIFNAVEAFGGKAVMTSANHRSGTDRCHEAYMKSKSDADIIINAQGDEPFIEPRQIDEIMSCFVSPDVEIATLIRQFPPSADFTDISNPNTPKVVVDKNMNALLFSRSPIPYVRNAATDRWPASTTFYAHIGMYAYRADILAEITALPQSDLEKAESLEQLRWLENGYKIRTAVSCHATIGIDTPDDLERARQYVNSL